MGIGGGGGSGGGSSGGRGDERLDVYIRTNHRPAGTGARRGRPLEWEKQIKTSAPVGSRRHDEDKWHNIVPDLADHCRGNEIELGEKRASRDDWSLAMLRYVELQRQWKPDRASSKGSGGGDAKEIAFLESHLTERYTYVHIYVDGETEKWII